MGYYDNKWWEDLKDDQERVEFLMSDTAFRKGLIAGALVEDVAEAFAFRARHSHKYIMDNLPKMVEALADVLEKEGKSG